ncbi:MAG: hypothetical protein PF542_01070 [Nanoarchaeota archaeon]|jgi:hypothetical protein|nr:hypothetical protein [Nanoarchaeota archaeon]
MKKGMIFSVLIGFVLIGFVYFIYLGGFMKVEYSPQNYKFSAVSMNCSNAYFDDTCFDKLTLFLDENNVDSHKTLTIYDSQDGLFGKGCFDKAVVLDSVELSRLQGFGYSVLNFDKRYLVLEFPYKSRWSSLVSDYKVNRLTKEKFLEKDVLIKENLMIYDSVNSKLIYLLEVGY